MIKTHDGTQSRRIVAVGDRYPSQGFQRPRTQITAVGGETSITLPANLSYKPGLNQITVKRSTGGALLVGLDFFETSTTTIGFPTTDPLQAGEIVEVTLEAVTTGIAAIAPRPDCYTATATAGQTVITSSFSWPYNLNSGKAIGGVSLYINGILQTRGVDYTEVNLSLANTNQVDVTLGGALVGGENIVLVPTYQVIDDAGASTQFNNSRFGALLTDPASVVALASSALEGIVSKVAQSFSGVKTFLDGVVVSQKLWVGASSSLQQSITATSATNLPTPVTLTFTAPVTGKYKIYCNVLAYAPTGAQMTHRIGYSAGTLIFQQDAQNCSDQAISTMPFVLLTLTKNTAYTFNVQSWVSSGTGLIRSDRFGSGIVVVAELIEQTA